MLSFPWWSARRTRQHARTFVCLYDGRAQRITKRSQCHEHGTDIPRPWNIHACSYLLLLNVNRHGCRNRRRGRVAARARCECVNPRGRRQGRVRVRVMRKRKYHRTTKKHPTDRSPKHREKRTRATSSNRTSRGRPTDTTSRTVDANQTDTSTRASGCTRYTVCM